MITRRDLLSAALPGAVLFTTPRLLGALGRMRTLPELHVRKTPGCSCCDAWADHLRSHGLTVTVEGDPDLASFKDEMGIPEDLRSCHTAVADDYTIEGHVPAEDVLRLFEERPEISGIAVPDMPTGSPGMDMTDAQPDAYQVVAWRRDGRRTIWSDHPGAEGRPSGPDSQGATARAGMSAEVDLAARALALTPGMVVAEIGAGSGRFALQLAEFVRPGGRVYVNDLGRRQIQAIEQRIANAGVDDVIAVQGAVDDTNLPAGEMDALTMRMVYHMMTDPEPMDRSFFRALKPGGTMLVIEGYPKNGPNARGVPANRSGMGIDPQIAIDEITGAGFEFVKTIDPWPSIGYAMVFRKPTR